MQNVFLTGASVGIGLETAKLLTDEGFQVWGTSRNLSRLPTMQGFHPVQLDLSIPDSIQAAYTTALKQAGKIDILINNAGSGTFGPLENIPVEIWHEQMQILVFGPLQLIKLAIPNMRVQGGGIIVNISSLAARFPIPFMSPYNAAKAAFSSLTQSLRLELGHNNPIHVIDLQPGDIRTPFHESMKFVKNPRDTDYFPAIENAEKVIEKNMSQAPEPKIVAKEILRIIHNPASGPVAKAGGFFQTIMAAAGARIASSAMRERAIRHFYCLDEKL